MDWIATLTTHIPDRGEQLVRYYGYYSNVSRGKRKKEKPEDKTEISEIDAPPVSKELEKRWSYFSRKVYETDPLTCPKCQGEMWFDKLTTLRKLEGRIISFIDQPDVIKKSFNTWVYGKSPTPLQKGTKEKKRSLLTPPTVRPFESLTALRRIEG